MVLEPLVASAEGIVTETGPGVIGGSGRMLARMRCLPWPAHSREKPASSHGTVKFRETRTLRWREPDSNHRSRRGIVVSFDDLVGTQGLAAP